MEDHEWKGAADSGVSSYPRHIHEFPRRSLVIAFSSDERYFLAAILMISGREDGVVVMIRMTFSFNPTFNQTASIRLILPATFSFTFTLSPPLSFLVSLPWYSWLHWIKTDTRQGHILAVTLKFVAQPWPSAAAGHFW